MAAAKELSVDAALTAASLGLDGRVTLKEECKNGAQDFSLQAQLISSSDKI